MKKVITYGTYDMLHYGHIRLLERAKALGDYLIVGVTSDDFDKTRGKINVQQSLAERVNAVRETGLADQIIVEEYEGQKIDDIQHFDVDIFAIGSDWRGKFDYLNEYCEVVYLERTQGISSTQLRSANRSLRIGFVGGAEHGILDKYIRECGFVNGAEVAGVYWDSQLPSDQSGEINNDIPCFASLAELLTACDAIYIGSHPNRHFEQIREALQAGKHVLCESPIALKCQECQELFELAEQNKLILMDAIKTAYSTAYNRLFLLLKGGRIGKIVSIDATCTSLKQIDTKASGFDEEWNSICAWGPTALLPIFQLLGVDYKTADISSLYLDYEKKFDAFTKIAFNYPNAVASIKVGRGVKSEGSLIVSGTSGYVYVPAPWWKTDYFEIRYEHQEDNRRYFYQLDGEGIRYELVAFVKSINSGKLSSYVEPKISEAISKIMSLYYDGTGKVIGE